jgi:hypothetical protein
MIRISNLTVSTKAAVGATVGTLTMMNAGGTVLASNFTLNKGAGGFFGISGSNLVTEISAIPPGIYPGIYSVEVRGVATNAYYANNCYFTITVTS